MTVAFVKNIMHCPTSRNLKLHIDSIDNMKRIHGIQDTSKCNICSRAVKKLFEKPHEIGSWKHKTIQVRLTLH